MLSTIAARVRACACINEVCESTCINTSIVVRTRRPRSPLKRTQNQLKPMAMCKKEALRQAIARNCPKQVKEASLCEKHPCTMLRKTTEASRAAEVEWAL
jgi:hypothetical protein